MELTSATLSGITALQAICRKAYAENFADHWLEGTLELYLEQQFGNQRLTSDLGDPKIEYYTINENNTPVGFIKIKYQSNLPGMPADEGCELEKMYVTADRKGLGTGKAALGEIIEKVRESGAKTLFLCVLDTNLPAISFYKKMGFVFHSTTRLDNPNFKEELKGMYRMYLELQPN